jgi:hypothetical protein
MNQKLKSSAQNFTEINTTVSWKKYVDGWTKQHDLQLHVHFIHFVQMP